MERKLKICFFHLGFVYSGGGERLVLQEMDGLAKRGHEVTCYTPLLDKINCFPDIINNYDIRTILPSFLYKIVPRQSLRIILSIFWVIVRMKEYRGYDVFVGANQPGPLFCWIVKLFLKKPYLIYLAQPTRIIYPRKVDREAGMIFKDKFLLLPFLVKIFNPLIVWLDRVSVQKADKMLINGDYMLRVIEQVYGREGSSCPAGSSFTVGQRVDKWRGIVRIKRRDPSTSSHFAQASSSARDDMVIPKPYIFLSNRHFPQKKFEWALEAFSQLPKLLQKKVQFVISGGETWYTDDLKAKISELRIEGRVLFTGLVNEKDLEKLYRHASIYVYPAPEEDYGMGVVEAMSTGTVPLAWDNAGPSTTIINDQTGILAKPHDIDDFSKSMKELLVDKRLNARLRNNAQKFAKKNYTTKNHISCFEKAVLEMIEV